MSHDISLSIVKRRVDDKTLLSSIYVCNDYQDPWIRKIGVRFNTFYYVLPVEGRDATAQLSAYRNPIITVDGERLIGRALVYTNNEERFFFPFSLRAFKGLLVSEVTGDQGGPISMRPWIKATLTIEDVEGTLKDCREQDVQCQHTTSFTHIVETLMPY